MKKVFSILMVLTLLFCFAACSNNTTNEESSSLTQQSANPSSTHDEELNNSNDLSVPDEESNNANDSSVPDEESNNTNDSSVPTETDSKSLVVYFSWSGNTQTMANWVAEKTGGELFRIVPEVAYTQNDVFDRSKNELDNGIRPTITTHIDAEVMAGYDTVFLGFPIWWYDLPMPVWTFLEEYDFSGKTVIPFFTHNGSSSGAGSL